MKEENETLVRCLNMFGRIPEQWELLNCIETQQRDINMLCNRINKAIEYVEDGLRLGFTIPGLLKILKGDDHE